MMYEQIGWGRQIERGVYQVIRTQQMPLEMGDGWEAVYRALEEEEE